MLFTVAEIADFLYNVLFTVSCNYYSRRNSLSTFKKSLAVGSSDYNDQFVFNAWLPCPHFLSLLMCNNSSGDRKWVKATVWSIEQSDSVSTLTFMTYTDLWLWYPQWQVMTYTDLWLWYPQWQVKWCHPAYSIDAKNGWPWISQLGWCRALQRCIETAIWTLNRLVPIEVHYMEKNPGMFSSKTFISFSTEERMTWQEWFLFFKKWTTPLSLICHF